MRACFFVSSDMRLAHDPTIRRAVEAMGFSFQPARSAVGIRPDSSDIVILDIRSVPLSTPAPPFFLRASREHVRVVGIVRSESTEHHAMLLDLGVDTVVPGEREHLSASLAEAIRELSATNGETGH